MDVRLAVGIDGGDVEGEAHVVVLEQHARAVPGFSDDLAVGLLAFGKGTYDHFFKSSEKRVVVPQLLRSVRQPRNAPA
ncbi:hypothetical protein D3C77_704730 [compost metagenome]